MLRQLVILLAMTSVALAAAYIQPLEEKPEEYKDCDGCWVSKIEEFIPLGEARPSPTQCMEYRCTKDYVEVVSCGVVAVSPPCTVIRDVSLLYPKCCAQLYCPPKLERK